MEHTEKTNTPKFKHHCSLPLTGTGVVDLLITDLCVFEIDRKCGGAKLIELAPSVTLEKVRAKTEADFEVGCQASVKIVEQLRPNSPIANP